MKRVLVSGATGLIGQAIVKFLLRENEYVIALARSIERAESIFGKSNKNLEYIISDVCDIEPKHTKVRYQGCSKCHTPCSRRHKNSRHIWKCDYRKNNR